MQNLSFSNGSYVVGVHRLKFNQVYTPQNRSMRCWAACISMLLKYFNLNVDQNDLAKNICGINSWGFTKNCPASSSEISQSLNFYVDHNEYRYQVNAPLSNGAPSINTIITQLYDKKPILVAYNTGSAVGHAVLITGCEFSVTNGQTSINKLFIRDPENSFQNRLRNGRKEITNVAGFWNSIHSYWITDVHVQQLFPSFNLGTRFSY